MAADSRPGPPTLEHRHLRSALEFALGLADAGQKLKPPLAFPAELKPFMRQHRLPTGALGRVRRIIEADLEFRQRVAEGAVGELVDPVGIEWLRREEGWEKRVAGLVEQAETAQADAAAEQAMRRAEKRRGAAESAAARSRAEVVGLTERLAERERELSAAAAAARAAAEEMVKQREEVAAAKLGTRHAIDRASADRKRQEVAVRERDAAIARAEHAERQRDELLSERAERAGVAVTPAQLIELRALAASARSLAERIAALIEVPGPRRKHVALPGGAARDSRAATEHLVSLPSVLVLVDGYNVAKLTWPELSLGEQRERLLDAVDTVARRSGSEIAVVFDGADVVGAHSSRRRLARVRYSPPGVTADDVIRDEVHSAEQTRPIVVVTDDGEIRRDVAAEGANLVSSGAFADFALR